MIKGYRSASRQAWYYVYSGIAYAVAAYVGWLACGGLSDRDPPVLAALVILAAVTARLGWIVWRYVARPGETPLSAVGRGLAAGGDLVPSLTFGVKLRTVVFGLVLGAAVALAAALPNPLDHVFGIVALLWPVGELVCGRPREER
jgi:hypothetical protein